MRQTIILRTDRDRVAAHAAIDRAPLDGRQRFALEEHKDTRSEAQNRCMWGWYSHIRLRIADSTGQLFSDTEMHEWCMEHVLPPLEDGDYKGGLPKPVMIDGKETMPRISSTKLTVKGMAKYLTALDMWAADSLHLLLPRGDDYYSAMGATRRAAA